MSPQATLSIHQTATVQPGGVIILRQPQFSPGTQVEVFIMPARDELAALSDEEFSAGFDQALAEAGYDTVEKIVELVREVKREQADELAQVLERGR